MAPMAYATTLPLLLARVQHVLDACLRQPLASTVEARRAVVRALTRAATVAPLGVAGGFCSATLLQVFCRFFFFFTFYFHV